MTYHKILVDNTTCMRRFHVAFDDENKTVSKVALECPHCGEVVFARKDHPEAVIIREENIVRCDRLSPNRAKTCKFEDKYSPKPEPI